MKVRVQFTVEVDDDLRRAIAYWYGFPGKASRETIRDFIETYGPAALADARYEWESEEGA